MPPVTGREQRLLLAVSLKMYLSVERTREWMRAIAPMAGHHHDVEIAVLPTFPLLESAERILDGTGVRWGAQDVAPSLDGAQTGEVSAVVLTELGCTYVEIGHAERRRLFGERDETVVAKLRTATCAGLVPVLCVGEGVRLAADEAAGVVAAELRMLLEHACPGQAPDELVVAYEPGWAIGADEPAEPSHVRSVVVALRAVLADLAVRGRVIYGGAAGTETLDELWPDVDGLFLGRFAHDPSAVQTLVDRARDLQGAATR